MVNQEEVQIRFPTPRDMPGGGVGRPKHPIKIPPPENVNFCLHDVSELCSGTIFVGKKNSDTATQDTPNVHFHIFERY